MSSASSTRPSIKISSTTTNITSSAKPSIGINPTSRVSNTKASSAKPPIKSSSSTKVASLAIVSSSTNKSGANELLFVSEEESFTKLPINPEPAIRRSAIVSPPIRLSAIAPTALEYILEVSKSVESNIDLNNLDS